MTACTMTRRHVFDGTYDGTKFSTARILTARMMARSKSTRCSLRSLTSHAVCRCAYAFSFPMFSFPMFSFPLFILFQLILVSFLFESGCTFTFTPP